MKTKFSKIKKGQLQETKRNHENNLRKIISNSTRLGDVTHFEVRNLSAWYQVRSLLGPKRQSVRIIHQTDKKDYSAEIFVPCIPKNRASLPSFKKRKLGTCPTYYEAFTKCEKACNVRDRKTIGNRGMETHFHVLIVSPIFQNLEQYDRAKLLLEDLMEVFSTPIAVDSEQYVKSSSDKNNGMILFGNNYRSLNHLRILHLPFEILVDLRTPHQYNNATNTVHIPLKNDDNPDAAPSNLRAEVRYLKELNKHNSPEKNKQGFDHFFHGLEKQSKRLVLQEYERNSKIAKQDKTVLNQCVYKDLVVTKGKTIEPWKVGSGGRDNESTDQKVGSKQHRINSVHQLFSGDNMSRSASQKENSIICKYLNLRYSQVEFAIRIQRMFRRSILLSVHRKWKHEHKMTLKIQCHFRKWLANNFVLTRKKNWTVSSIMIQQVYRGWKSRILTKIKRNILTYATKTLQPLVRGWIGRKYFKWMRDNWNVALLLQRIIRGFLARCLLSQLQREELENKCQKLWGTMEKLYSRCVNRYSIIKIIQYYNCLAYRSYQITLVQSHVRRKKALTSYHLYKIQKCAASNIQKYVRGICVRERIRNHRYLILQDNSSIIIQAHIRGFIDRSLYQLIQSEQHHHYKEIPSAIKIQTIVRMYFPKKKFGIKIKRWHAVIKIQKIYRMFVSKEIVKDIYATRMEQRVTESIIFIQTQTRKFLCQKSFHLKLQRERARRLLAGRVIYRAWHRFREHKKFQKFQRILRKLQSSSRLEEVSREMDEIIKDSEYINMDLNDTKQSIEWARTRKKQVYSFREEVEQRISELKKFEVDNESCFNEIRGVPQKEFWSIELVKERKKLFRQDSMAKEEIRLLSNTISESKVHYCMTNNMANVYLSSIVEVCLTNAVNIFWNV